MSLLGHDVRAVGRIKQTVQCVVNGRVQGNVHLEGRVVRDLFSLLGVDCLASMKTYEHTGEFPMGVGHRVENGWGLTKVAVVLLIGLIW